MSETSQLTPLGRSNPPNEAWLAKQPSEPIRDPDLAVSDTHHHLWQRPQHRYFLDELLADLRSGHVESRVVTRGDERLPVLLGQELRVRSRDLAFEDAVRELERR